MAHHTVVPALTAQCSSGWTALFLIPYFLLPLLVLYLQPSFALPTSFHPGRLLFFLETALRGSPSEDSSDLVLHAPRASLTWWQAVLRVCLSPRPDLRPYSTGRTPSECAPGGGTYESPEVLNELDGAAEESGGHFCPFRLEESAGQKEMVVELILLKP